MPEWGTAYAEHTWFIYVAQLLHADSMAWREVVCMQSGYSALLGRHWEEAIRQFTLHLIAYDTGRQIYSATAARYYFNSYIKLSTKSGQLLRQHLVRMDAKQPPKADAAHPYRYEELRQGRRYADGRPIPPNAPPRPSATAVWNDSTDEWTEFFFNGKWKGEN